MPFYAKKAKPKAQDESIWLALPMKEHLELDGWWVQNISCTDNAQQGLPDYYIGKKGFIPRWIEWKIVRNNSITFKLSQKNKFPEMQQADIPVYICCTRNDLRGKKGYRERCEIMKTILGPVNVHMMFETWTYKYLFRSVG